MRTIAPLLLLALIVPAEAALAQTTVPNIFTSGTPAVAAEVNENFQALATAIDSVVARLDKLEGVTPVTDADVVGSYHSSNLQIGTVWGSNEMEAISYEGTFVFAADHTFTWVFTGRENDSDGPDPDDGALAGTWSLTAGVLSAGLPGSTPITLHCTLACRVIVTTLEGSAEMVGDDAHNNMLILVRAD